MSGSPAPLADTTTPVYNFILPEIGASDDTWGNKNNANWTAADAAIAAAAADADTASSQAAGALAAANAAQTTANAAMPKAGGSFTGAVTVQAPATDMQPATKKYVDDIAAAASPGAAFRDIAGTTGAMVNADNGKAVYFTGGAAATFVVGILNDGVATMIQQQGAGQVTVTATGGATLISPRTPAAFKTAGVGSMLTVICRGTSVFVGGDATA